ncbi:MAG TPA: hypothetical protein PLJ21_07755 [Pseudobdellovibrionaceae bacterium]|nr:hypothetical protein [Pseudobdellovibrionaceae bacterium]
MLRKQDLLFLIFTTLLLGFNLGCGKAKSESAASASTTEDAGGGNQSTPPSSAFFYVHGKSTEGININTHEASSWDKKCQVDLDDPDYADRDIYCTVEIKELDLYHQGLQLQYNVPSSNKCVYVKFYPYFFYQFKPGVGPGFVYKTINLDGSITITSTGGDAGGAITNVNGLPVCGFNYTGLYPDSGYPNCCLGTYTLQTTDLNAPPGEQTTTDSGFEWGGDLGSCLGGAGKDHYPSKVQKFPRPYIERLGGSTTGTTLENKYTISAPIQLEYGTNIHIANYLSNPSSPPAAFAAPSSFSTYVPNMYYDWICLDEAEEQYARIRVSVREWNLSSEFIKKSAGDPDSSGTETDWADDINDRWDWTDYIGWGGFTGYPWSL